MTTTSLATEPYATHPTPVSIRIERLLPGPPERVWSYLTDSGKRAKWFAGGPMDLRDGGGVSLTFRNSDLSEGQPNPYSPSPDGIDHVMTGVITRCEPPHVLSFNWSPDGSGTQTTFELHEEGTDTRLVITQDRTASLQQRLGMTAGWHVHVGILADLLAERKPRIFWPEHIHLRKVYEDRVES